MIYAAYGSNLNKEQMAFRCPGAEPIGTAYLDGYRLAFKGSLTGAYLTIEEAEGHKVPVGLWKVSGEDEKNLDRYEGYPVFYRKEEIGTGEHTATIYIMNSVEYGLPSVRYAMICVDGYRDFGFDVEYLREACDYSLEQMMEVE